MQKSGQKICINYTNYRCPMINIFNFVNLGFNYFNGKFQMHSITVCYTYIFVVL